MRLACIGVFGFQGVFMLFGRTIYCFYTYDMDLRDVHWIIGFYELKS